MKGANKQNLIIGLVIILLAAFAIYLYIKRNNKVVVVPVTVDAKKELFRYNSFISEIEKFRYANFSNFTEFRMRFKESILTALKAKTFSEKKELLEESKKLFNLFLDDYPTVKAGYKLVMNLIMQELVPLFEREIKSLLFEEDGKTLKSRIARDLCKMGQTGPGLFDELFKKYIEAPLGGIIDTVFNAPGVKLAVSGVKYLGLNLKSLAISAIKGLSQDKLGDILDKGVGYLEKSLSTVAKRPISCRPSAEFSTPEDIIISETDQADFDDL